MSSKIEKDIDTYLQEIRKILDTLVRKAKHDEKTRKMLVARLQKLMTAVKMPADAVWHMIIQVRKLAFA